MHKRALLSLLIAVGSLRTIASAQTGIVVIGHPGIEKIDAVTVERIFTGKIVELAGVSVKPINIISGSALRARFLQIYLNQDEDRYVAYWTVRRYIGKGVPPRELSGASEVIRFVQSTPGAIGYIDETYLTPGLNIVPR